MADSDGNLHEEIVKWKPEMEDMMIIITGKRKSRLALTR